MAGLARPDGFQVLLLAGVAVLAVVGQGRVDLVF